MDTSRIHPHLRPPAIALLCVLGAAQAQEAPTPRAMDHLDYALEQDPSPVFEAYAAETERRFPAPLAFDYEAFRRTLLNALAEGRWALRARPGGARPDLWQRAGIRPARSGITSVVPMPMDDGGFFVELELKY